MPKPIDLSAFMRCLRLCGVVCMFIRRLLSTRKRRNPPLYKASPAFAPLAERLTLEVKFSTSLTRRTL